MSYVMDAARAESFADVMTQLLKARQPLLAVESFEEDRVLDEIRGIVTDQQRLRTPRAVKVFTLTDGIHDPGDGKGKAQAPDVALKAALGTTEPTVFVFFDLHHYLGTGSRPPDPVVVRCLRDIADRFRSGSVASTAVMVSPTVALPADLEKVVTVVDFPLPDQKQIHGVVDEIISANAQSDRITINLDDGGKEKLVKAALGLTRTEAENAFARAIVRDGVLDVEDVSVVLEEKQQTIRKSGLLEFMPPQGSMDDIGGLENLKRWLTKRQNSWLDAAEEWGLPFPKGVLITGVPGCGKSLTAKCSASLWGLPLLRLDVGRVFAGLVGSSEQNMRAALKMAEAVSPSVLWMDEIEKGFSDASGGGDSGTSQRVFGTFLTWMQEKSKPVFVIATANNIDRLPAEFMRKGRFDEIFFVDLPTREERMPIWRLQLTRRLAAGRVVGAELHVDDGLVVGLAERSEGFSGAEIEQVVITACFDAFAERRPMVREDLERGIQNTVPLSVTQAEKIRTIRSWASSRAVAASATEDQEEYGTVDPEEPEVPAGGGDNAVSGWRGGRRVEF
jgi:ATP-dependent 26S proteasome regulatory subunit